MRVARRVKSLSLETRQNPSRCRVCSKSIAFDGKGPRAAGSKSGAVSRPALAEVTPLLDLATDTEFQAALEQAIDAATPTDEPRAHLAVVGNHLQKLLPEFDSRNYGFKKLSDMLSKIPTVKLTWDGEPPRVYVERL
jgi:hypothetical protein